MRGCSDICKKHKPMEYTPSDGRYRNGQKRCQFCSVYMIWSGIFCPCCGSRLRSKPRNKKYKEQLRIAMEVRVR